MSDPYIASYTMCYTMCYTMWPWKNYMPSFVHKQAIKDLVKSARRSANHAFNRLQQRILRLEKKDQQESVRSGENNKNRRPDSEQVSLHLPSYDEIHSYDII